MARKGDIWQSPCGRMELRCGPWQEVLADVTECSTIITDPPYSKYTHGGNKTLADRYNRSTLDDYAWLTPASVRSITRHWISRSSGWFVAMTDDYLSWCYRHAIGKAGFYAFASVSLIQHRPRLTGDGPGSCTVHIQTGRPREKRFSSWGSLPGWYKANPDKTGLVNGGKPLPLMRAIVKDYSRPGDLIVDPCAGGGTTLLAAAIEGRRCIGAELDPKTYDLAVKRLSKGYTPRLQMAARPKPKQKDLL